MKSSPHHCICLGMCLCCCIYFICQIAADALESALVIGRGSLQGVCGPLRKVTSWPEDGPTLDKEKKKKERTSKYFKIKKMAKNPQKWYKIAYKKKWDI